MNTGEAPSRRRTIPPGDGPTVEQVFGGASTHKPLDGMGVLVAVAHVVLDRLSKPSDDEDDRPRRRGMSASERVLWLVVAFGYAMGGMHIVGDGTVREEVAEAKAEAAEARQQAEQTRKAVEWLVLRAQAEDAGKPPPPYPVL